MFVCVQYQNVTVKTQAHGDVGWDTVYRLISVQLFFKIGSRLSFIQFLLSLLWTHTASVITNTEDDWRSWDSGSTEGRMSETWRTVFQVLPVNLVHTWPITGVTAGVVVVALKCLFIVWMSTYLSFHLKKWVSFEVKGRTNQKWKEKKNCLIYSLKTPVTLAPTSTVILESVSKHTDMKAFTKTHIYHWYRPGCTYGWSPSRRMTT